MSGAAPLAAPLAAPGPARRVSIDVMRCVAMLLMIQVHFSENLSPRVPDTAWLYDLSAWLGVLAAPMFTFASGLSYSLWVRKQQANGTGQSAITRSTIRRGLFLFGAGLVFNVAVWLPEGLFNWDILTLIGVSLLLLAFARRIPPGALIVLCVVVLLLSPPLRAVLDYPAYWEHYEFAYNFTVVEVASGFFAAGYFPVFPWIIFPITGFVTGELADRYLRADPQLTSAAAERAIRGSLVALPLLAVADGGTQRLVEAPGRTLGAVTMYPASTAYVVLALGICLLALLLLDRSFDRSGRGGAGHASLPAFVRRASDFSLTIYVVHHLVHVWPLWIRAWAEGLDDLTFYLHRAVPTATALALALAFVLASAPALALLERHRRFSLEAVMRRVCDPPTSTQGSARE